MLIEDRHCARKVDVDLPAGATGAFQKYVVVQKDSISELPYKIPSSVGVVLPLGISTAAAGLYQKDFLALPLPSPEENPKSLDRTILIWGGSSSVGSCAIQLAVASGAEVVTTASPKNFDYCKDLGAKEVFDYHAKNVEDQLVKWLEEKTLAGAYHAVGADGAVQSCARIVDRSKGKAIVVTVRGVPDDDAIPKSVRMKASKPSPLLFHSNSADAVFSLLIHHLHQLHRPHNLARLPPQSPQIRHHHTQTRSPNRRPGAQIRTIGSGHAEKRRERKESRRI